MVTLRSRPSKSKPRIPEVVLVLTTRFFGRPLLDLPDPNEGNETDCKRDLQEDQGGW